MGAGLYDAAFATLGRPYGYRARSAITTLTLFGGLASTICWPISAFLMAEVGWRGACLSYAAVQLVIALPLYLLILPRDTPGQAARPEPKDPAVSVGENNSNLGMMVVLATTLTLAAVISSTLSVHLLSILQGSGMALAAAVVLGALVGPSQVGARAVEMMVARYHHPIWIKFASVTFVAIGVSMLWAGLPVIPMALGFYGAGIGLETIARGTLPLALFGPFRVCQADGPPCYAEPLSAGSGSVGWCIVVRTCGCPRCAGGRFPGSLWRTSRSLCFWACLLCDDSLQCTVDNG
ncbi:MFS transporter [Mesorhizobium sp. VK24D]|uniref:MFS transporter n=1 Tax=Mesorhizobium album TaxID=3072314 RepID=A0ABU4Y5V7_9HYPH|nr:MFS transporter [Mesorhizobium sp. VK24D]MDX8482283.1 MFS transporter [Mesorhizobium sp. VK24D]